MFNRKTPDGLVDQAAATADAAVEGAHRLADQASSMAEHGMDVVRDTSRMVSRSAQQATDKTAAFVRDEPLKAILMTAVATAGLIAIFNLFSRSR